MLDARDPNDLIVIEKEVHGNLIYVVIEVLPGPTGEVQDVTRTIVREIAEVVQRHFADAYGT